MFVGKVYRIMIGSPSDIEEEVSIAKNIILQWSCLNAETHNIVVLPLHWKENSYPGCGNHPQKMLDNQLVNNSDMLVCIFGSRIGTPTDTSESGSIEEIEEHIKAGKQVMIFFKKSSQDIYSIDKEQFEKIKKFRDEFQSKSLWVEYDDAHEFGELFQQKLSLFINSNWIKLTEVEEIDGPQKETVQFTNEELQIFARWASDKTGSPYTHMTFMGGRTEIHLAYRFGVTLTTPQEEAEWEDFMERLNSLDYIRLDNYDKYGHPRYKITSKGYKFGESIIVLEHDEVSEVKQSNRS